MFEVEDVFPRIREDRPNVYVGSTASKRLDRYVAAIEGGRKGPRDIRGRVRGHVPELTSDRFPRPTPLSARRLKGKLQRKLGNRGYRVIVGGPDVAVYVIELDPSTTKAPIAKGWVYVGTTGKDVSARFGEHLSDTSTKITRGRCVQLRDDLAPDERVRPTMRLDAEARTAERLIAQGYDVYTDAIDPSRRTRPRG